MVLNTRCSYFNTPGHGKKETKESVLVTPAERPQDPNTTFQLDLDEKGEVVDPYSLSDESGAEQSDSEKKSNDILEQTDYDWDINRCLRL